MAKRSEKSLALVVVTHNSSRWISGLISSWEASLAKAGIGADRAPELIIADSGSTDDTVEVAKKLMPTVKVVMAGNVGYGAAANRGMKLTTARWILLSNPDVTFPEDFASRFIAPVLGQSADWVQRAAVVAPRLLNEDGTPQPSVGRFPTLGGMMADQFRKRPMRKYVFPQPTTETAVDWICGACLLLRREAVLQAGGFDRMFFLYVEEVDLEYRLAKAGWQRWFIPEAHVVHHAPNANRPPRPAIQRYAARGLLRYFAKHGSMMQLMACRILILLARRLPFIEVFATRGQILLRSTGEAKQVVV